MYHSQWNQDRWLNENIFQNKKGGFFVDVGAHDGVEINNTLFFEKYLDWKGICIEPIPEIFAKLKKNRSGECIHGCAYNRDGLVRFNRICGYSEMLSGIQETYSQEHFHRIDSEIHRFGGKRETLIVDAYRLETLFDVYGILHVDYLSIDTEGSELQVLKGINFKKVEIDVIEVEVNYEKDEKLLTNFLLEKGYVSRVKLGGDRVFVKK